jgi:cysteinyl-tRNA synthetase
MALPAFKIYDTLTRQVKGLQTAEPGHLRFYSCGPTVYSFAHIGNFRTFLSADLVVRTAEALGWRVSYVSNITDVGHLTEDDVADASGEDKMAKGLRSKEGQQFVNVWDLAEYYADSFKEDWRRMNLKEPLVWPKATQHMREQIVAIQKLIELGHAYETPTGVYFSVGSFKEYGKLSGNTDQDKLLREVREVVSDENKRHPSDFALWKKDPNHLMQWFSPWGWGFPGWHIECSVMSMAYLGETIDLHAGGEDLVFPHHECEIAQSESLTGKPFCPHWMHTRFLQVNGEKMSKSKGNWYTVRDLVEGKGVDPLALRYALISVPYGKPLNFTLQTLEDAIKAVERFKECDRLAAEAAAKGKEGEDALGETLTRLFDEALAAMCDDLNTSIALAKVYEGTKVILREAGSLTRAEGQSALDWLDKVNGLLGIVRPDYERFTDSCPGQAMGAASGPSNEEIESRIAERAAAKKTKDFAKADEIRQWFEANGLELRDTPEGTVWKRRAGL